jgi:hypothetical protein
VGLVAFLCPFKENDLRVFRPIFLAQLQTESTDQVITVSFDYIVMPLVENQKMHQLSQRGWRARM